MKKIILPIILLFLLSACTPTNNSQETQALQGHMAHGTSEKVSSTKMERSITSLEEAKPSSTIMPKDGEIIQFSADIIKKEVNGKQIRMFGYNKEIPGPLFKVKQGQTISLNFTNNLDMETTIHSHGIRIENQYDGIPGVTQDPILPGETFLYKISFPDSGLFWYHPHIREDYQQELGLYGTYLVIPKEDNQNKVDREEVLILDDLKLEGDDVYFYTEEQINNALMGRFGNIMLINGKTDYSLTVEKGEVIRFYLTNVANVRPFKLSFTDAKMKVIASDLSNFESEYYVDSLIIGPAERYIIEVLFEKEGISYLQQKTHHGTYLLGEFDVSGSEGEKSTLAQFQTLRKDEKVSKEMDALSSDINRSPDVEWKLTINVQGMGRMMHADEGGMEYEDPMPMMSPLMTNRTLKWQIIDMKTGTEAMGSHYHWKAGERVKIRIQNDPSSMHPMQHPIHFHGQRFVVLAVDGKEVENKVWKDTALIPVGRTYDILLEVTNPGDWMAHCHIAEHLQSGMMTMFDVS